ncbi:MAG: hypothetical protein JJLCMIEE_02274 [Acidimicrobiales bacterium]|nr:MAG: DUF58 domain-containing protein [Actinomycetota bacterium]MBV6509206.1 hypothetical protein [Acidimicrobiales bacterium]RIK08608.1 MAG: DUF58 domain-containing protein [Acidobacteriota bacterium]
MTVPRAPGALAHTGGTAEELLRRLELDILRKLDGLLHGEYTGLVPGHGTEPGETREYQPGDDVRRIDWNVTARTATPHVREPIADRELESWLLVDASSSLAFGTANCEKRDLALAAVAGIGFLTARTGNRLGAIIHRQGENSTFPARNGRKHLLAILHRLATTEAVDGEGDTELGPAIHRLNQLERRRGLSVVISDFIGSGGWEKPLATLAVRHDVLCIEIIDPREMDLPDVGVLAVVDPETGERREIHTGSEKLRRRYREAAAEQREQIGRSIRSAGADHLVLRTDRDWLLDMARFVSRRKDRKQELSRPVR